MARHAAREIIAGSSCQYGLRCTLTMQRRVREWKLQYGAEQEVMFRQRHQPGLRGLSDFTELKGVVVTIAGKLLAHKLYHFRLEWSHWSWMRVVLGGESFSALAEGLQEALGQLGGVPAEHKTDSLRVAWKQARAQLKLNELLLKLDRYRVIVVDDLGYVKRDNAETGVLFELIAHRYERGSLVITSNNPFSSWGSIFVDETMAVAAADRLIHHGYMFELKGESYRKKTAKAVTSAA